MLRKIIYFLFYPLLLRVYSLKNAFQGKVYILGDSAEIKLYDLKKFDDAPMLCFNRSYLLNDIKQRKNKTFQILGEPFHFVPGKYDKTRQAEVEFLKRAMMSSNNLSFVHLTNLPFLKKKNIHYVFHKLPKDSITSNLLDDNIKPFQWTGSIAINLACYMGFNEIVFIGISNHTYSYLSHWYKRGLKKNNLTQESHVNQTRGLRGFNLTKLISDYNVSTIVSNPISQSVFKTVFYEDYTGVKLSYKENIELVDYEYLKVLERVYPGEVL